MDLYSMTQSVTPQLQTTQVENHKMVSIFSLFLLLCFSYQACSLSIVIPTLDRRHMQIPLLDMKLLRNIPSLSGLVGNNHLSRNVKLLDINRDILDDNKLVERKTNETLESSYGEAFRKAYPGKFIRF